MVASAYANMTIEYENAIDAELAKCEAIKQALADVAACANEIAERIGEQPATDYLTITRAVSR